MIATIFSIVGLGMGLGALYRLFYGIITLVFNPTKQSLEKLTKLTTHFIIAIVIYVVCVFLVNSFLANTNLHYLQFTFSQIFYNIGARISRRF